MVINSSTLMTGVSIILILGILPASATAFDPYADEIVEFERIDGEFFTTTGDNMDFGTDALGPPGIDPSTDSSCTIESGDVNGCWTSPGYVPGSWNEATQSYESDQYGHLDTGCDNSDPSSCPRAGHLTVRFSDNLCEINASGPTLRIWEVGAKTEGFQVEILNGGMVVDQATSLPIQQATNGPVEIDFAGSGFFDQVRITPTDNGGGDPLAQDTSGPDIDAIECTVASEPHTVTGCTRTQGYWRTHSEFGPAPYDETWSKLENGASTDFFESPYTYYEILWARVRGNGYIILSHQYIAAELNILSGASMPAGVVDAFAETQGLLERYEMAATIGKNNPDRDRAIDLARILDEYNNGFAQPASCG